MDDRRDPARPSPDPAAAKPDRNAIAPTATPETGGGERSTTSQLRDDIDSGRTHDKVAHSDPAAAPLGTDAEAAGAPPTPDEVATARRHETARTTQAEASASRTAPQTARRSGSTMVWVIVAAVVIAIILAFIF